MPAKQKPIKKVSKKKETRNRIILYISAVSIGLPLLFANIYLQNQNSDVLGARVTPTGVQDQGNNGNESDVQNKLTCDMCAKAVHGDAVIVLQKLSQNPKEWGAICLPKAALNSTVTPSPRPFPSSFPTPKTSNTPTASFKNMPYISCPQPSPKPSGTVSGTPTPKFNFGQKGNQHSGTRPTETPNR